MQITVQEEKIKSGRPGFKHHHVLGRCCLPHTIICVNREGLEQMLGDIGTVHKCTCIMYIHVHVHVLECMCTAICIRSLNPMHTYTYNVET